MFINSLLLDYAYGFRCDHEADKIGVKLLRIVIDGIASEISGYLSIS